MLAILAAAFIGPTVRDDGPEVEGADHRLGLGHCACRATLAARIAILEVAMLARESRFRADLPKSAATPVSE